MRNNKKIRIKLTNRGKGCVNLSKTKMLPKECEIFVGFFNKFVWGYVLTLTRRVNAPVDADEEDVDIENSTKVFEM